MTRKLQREVPTTSDRSQRDRRTADRHRTREAPSRPQRGSRRSIGESRGRGYLRAQVAGRFAAGLLLLIGVRALVTLLAKTWGSRAAYELVAVGIIACVGAVVAWFIRWDGKLPRHALAIELAAFTLIAMTNWADPNPWAYGALFGAVFVWIGLVRTIPQTARAMVPAAIAYLFPLVMLSGTGWIGSLGPEAAVGAAATVVISGLLGIALSWSGEQLRQAETLGRRRLSGLESVLASTVELAEPLEPALVTDMVVQIALQAFGADAAVLLGSGTSPDTAVILQQRHWNSAQRNQALAFPVTLTAELAAGNAVGAPSGWLPNLPEAGGEVQLLPLLSNDGLAGVLAIWWRWAASEYATRLDKDLAATFSRQAGAALARAFAFGALQHASMLDPLTGLGNRRAADAYIESLAPGDAIVMIDLDHFKRVNDEHGHPAGDQALRSLGSFLASALREGDRVARYGGEEFIMFVRNIHPAAMESLLERLRLLWNERTPVTTFSIGAAVHQKGSDPRLTLQAADIALYQAKERGRDRVVVAV